MKNTKEIQPILASIYVLNLCSKNENKDITNLCEYAFKYCLEGSTSLLKRGTVGETYERARLQVAKIIQEDTHYKKIMGECFDK